MAALTVWQSLWHIRDVMNDAAMNEDDDVRDPLTGLPGLEAARNRIGEWLARRASGTSRIHALLLGLRRFDAVNLAFGKPSGDAALALVAGRIAHFAEAELDCAWHLSRGGGGSFLLIVDDECSRERWQMFAEQLADAVARPIAVPAGMLRLSPRLALMRGLNGESVDSMFDRLGQALEDAKDMQGARLNWADGETAMPGRTAAQLEADLLGAIDREEIEILFQPQFALPGDRLSGAEALARWNHATLGRIGAGALFTIAERADHIAPLSKHIARRALEAATAWRHGLRLSLNVTAADLAISRFATDLLEIVGESGFDPQHLTLEVTEQALLSDIGLAARTLSRLNAHGISVALDDFGAGFCNFRYLKLLPLHYLKLDRSMIDGITSDERDLAVLRAIVAMAGALDLKVIAEGVETEAQRHAITVEGCSYYQGFLRAQPMGPAQFLELAGG